MPTATVAILILTLGTLVLLFLLSSGFVYPNIPVEVKKKEPVKEMINMSDSDLYDELIREKAEEFGLPPALLKAVIKVESDFDPYAFRHEPWVRHLRSPDSSFGLTQILESTARELGFKGACRDLYHPATNIHYGAKYLKKQLDRYEGDVASAVAAYNAGTAVRRRGKFRNQKYVDRVTEAMEEYNDL